MQILSQIFQRSSSANLPPSHVSRLNVVPRPNVTATGAEEMPCRSKRRCFGNGIDKATISIVFSCCVCNPWNHRDPFGLFSVWLLSFHFTAGGLVVHASTSPTKRLALNTDIGGDAHRRFSEWHEAKPRTSLAADMSDRRHFALFVAFDLALLASLPLPDPQAPMVLTGTLRKWNPRPACGTAVKSVRISMSVFGHVPTRDEPAECLPWTR